MTRTTGPQIRPCLAEQRAKQVRAVGPAVQGPPGLVVPHLRLQAVESSAGYVRQVGDDQVHGAGQGLQQMAGEQSHAPGDAVSVGVLFGHSEGRGGDVRGQEAHVGQATARLTTMQPLPVPTSATVTGAGRERAQARASSTNVSVSGRGTMTAGVTRKSRPWNSLRPRR